MEENGDANFFKLDLFVRDGFPSDVCWFGFLEEAICALATA